jgi:hypothetical protein
VTRPGQFEADDQYILSGDYSDSLCCWIMLIPTGTNVYLLRALLLNLAAAAAAPAAAADVAAALLLLLASPTFSC